MKSLIQIKKNWTQPIILFETKLSKPIDGIYSQLLGTLLEKIQASLLQLGLESGFIYCL